MRRLRDNGNTLLVVEHEEAVIRAADWLTDIGPGRGETGGQLMFSGPSAQIADRTDSLTADYLTGRRSIPVPSKRRKAKKFLKLRGASLHNIKKIDADFPLGVFTCVTGVSGSGKSTLIHDVLYRAAERELGAGETSAKEHLGEVVGEYAALEGLAHVDEVVLVDQAPIGRTPRSNPVTYIKAWDAVRKLFADAPISRERGFAPGHFSFNVEGGRCEECKGAGAVEVEMIFEVAD